MRRYEAHDGLFSGRLKGSRDVAQERLAPRRVSVAYTEEYVDLKIVWVGGLEDTHRAIRSKGIDAVVRELRGAGYTDSKATEVLQAHGVVPRGNGRLCRSVITHRITRQGLQHRQTWRAGLLRIRELMEQNSSSRQTLEELKTNGPRHYHNTWNLRIVQQARWRLRTGQGPLHGVPPLSSDPKPSREVLHDAWLLLKRRRAEGRPWREVADELDAAGYRTATGGPFTDRRCAAMYSTWRRMRGPDV